jgi:hypothetical protein
MTVTNLRLTLDDARDAYQPGETLAGEYYVAPAEGDDAQALEISVLWSTEGKGDEDMAVHYFERVTADESAQVDVRQPRRFSTVLPNSPLTYDGVMVKIHWCVRLRAFLGRGKQLLEERKFRLGNIPPARAVLP